MPDHVHLIFTPLVDEQRQEVCSLARIMNAIIRSFSPQDQPGSAAEWQGLANRILRPVVRSSVSLDSKIQYLLENPVRKGLVNRWQEYPWVWQKITTHLYSADKRLDKSIFC